MRRGKSSRKGAGSRSQVEAIGIASGALPVRRRGAEQPCGIQLDGVAMIGVHVFDGASLGLEQRVGIGNLGQELIGPEIDNLPEARDQMGPRGRIRKKEKSLNPTKASAAGCALR